MIFLEVLGFGGFGGLEGFYDFGGVRVFWVFFLWVFRDFSAFKVPLKMKSKCFLGPLKNQKARKTSFLFARNTVLSAVLRTFECSRPPSTKGGWRSTRGGSPPKKSKKTTVNVLHAYFEDRRKNPSLAPRRL